MCLCPMHAEQFLTTFFSDRRANSTHASNYVSCAYNFSVGHVTNIQINTFRLFDNYIIGANERWIVSVSDRGKAGVLAKTVKCTVHFIYTLENSFWAVACLSLDNTQPKWQMGNLQLKRLTIYDIKRHKKHQRFNKFENSLISLFFSLSLSLEQQKQ